MTTAKEKGQSRTAKLGWGILLVLSAVFVLGGALSFFFEVVVSSFEEDTGVPLSEFRQAYPTVLDHLAREGRNLSILEVSLGLMALVVSLEGYRNGSRWAWNASWFLGGALAALGVHALFGGSPFVSLFSLIMAALALVGQLLARKAPALA